MASRIRCKLRPVGTKIAIKREVAPTESEGGILIPVDARTPPVLGYVVAVGKAVREIKVGEQVMFNHYCGSSLRIDGEDLLVMDVTDVLSIVEE